MKPAPFEYHAPTSLADVSALLAEHGEECKPLAGGQSLLPMLALRLTAFAHLVDLNRVDGLSGITRTNGTLTIGATTRQRALERDRDVATTVPLLARAAPFIGHFQIRNRGTVGGSLAHADPASELPAVALALDASFDVTGPNGRRSMAARDFFTGTWTTALDADEIVTAVHFPVAPPRTGSAVDEVARRHGDFAIAGAVAQVTLADDGRVARAAIAMFGVAPTPARADAAEAALAGRPAAAVDPTEIERLATEDLDPTDDIHATGAQRARIAGHLAARVVARAIEEATR
jgi:carbon-monoxide dehydrogenase medium subunit